MLRFVDHQDIARRNHDLKLQSLIRTEPVHTRHRTMPAARDPPTDPNVRVRAAENDNVRLRRLGLNVARLQPRGNRHGYRRRAAPAAVRDESGMMVEAAEMMRPDGERVRRGRAPRKVMARPLDDQADAMGAGEADAGLDVRARAGVDHIRGGAVREAGEERRGRAAVVVVVDRDRVSRVEGGVGPLGGYEGAGCTVVARLVGMTGRSGRGGSDQLAGEGGVQRAPVLGGRPARGAGNGFAAFVDR